MMIKLKQEVIEKKVVLEERDRIVLTDFLKIIKVVTDLLDDGDFCVVTTPTGEELDYGDLERISDIFEEFLNEKVITIIKN